MTTNKNYHKESKGSGRIMSPIANDGNNGGEIDSQVFSETELAFAESHLNRIKRLSIKAEDVVLVAIPMRESTWLEVIDACIYAGADFIMIDPVAEAVSLAETIERKKVNVVAATPRVWSHIHRQLNSYPGEIENLRVIRFSDRREPESHIYRIPAALNKQ